MAAVDDARQALRRPWVRPRVLHVVVGYGLRTYFLNAVRSVLATAPADPLLIIDNASPDDGTAI